MTDAVVSHATGRPHRYCEFEGCRRTATSVFRLGDVSSFSCARFKHLVFVKRTVEGGQL